MGGTVVNLHHTHSHRIRRSSSGRCRALGGARSAERIGGSRNADSFGVGGGGDAEREGPSASTGAGAASTALELGLGAGHGVRAERVGGSRSGRCGEAGRGGMVAAVVAEEETEDVIE